MAGEGFKIGDGFIDVEARVDRDRIEGQVRGALGGLAGIGSTIGKGLVAALFAGLTVSSVANVTAALAPLLSLVALAPGLALAGAAAFGVLKVGVAGFAGAAQAAASGDAAELDKRLQGLTPSARTAALAFTGLSKPIHDVSAAIQENLFAGWSEGLRPVVQQYVPVLVAGLPKIASSLGVFAENFLAAARNGPLLNGVRDVIDATARGLAHANDNVGPLTNMLGNLFSVAAPFIERMGSGFASLTGRLADFVNGAAQSGELTQWLNEALTVIRSIGSVLGNVGGIIGAVLGAANTQGGNLFQTLTVLTGQVRSFLESAQGTAALQGIFQAVAAFGDALRTSLAAVLPALGQALTAIAPQVGPISAALAGVVVALAPLIPVAGQLVAAILPQLAQTIQDLTPVISAVVGVIGTLGGWLAQYAGWIMPVVAGLVTMVGVFKLLSTAGTILSGVIRLIGLAMSLTPLGALIAGLALLVGAFIYAYTHSETFRRVVKAALDAVVGAAKAVGSFFAAWPAFFSGLWSSITSTFSGAVSAVVGFLIGLWSSVTSTFNSIKTAITSALSAVGSTVSGWVTSLVGFFTALPGRILAALIAFPGMYVRFWLDVMNRALFIVSFAIGSVIRFFIELPGRVIGAVAALPGRLAAIWTSVSSTATRLISAAVSAVVSFFAGLPGRAASAVSSLWGRLSGAFNTARSQATAVISAAVSAVVSFLTGLPGRAAGAVSSLWSRMSGAFSSARSQAASQASALVQGAINWIQQLPGKAASALSSLRSKITGAFSGAGSWLVSAGADVLRGLVNGMAGAVGAVVEQAKRAAQSVISGLKKGLGIGSPSKVARDEVGRWIPPGIADGIAAATPGLNDQVRAMIGGLPLDVPAPSVAPYGSGASMYAGGPAGSQAAGLAGAAAGYGMHVENLTVELRADDLRGVMDLADLLGTITQKARASRPGLVGASR